MLKADGEEGRGSSEVEERTCIDDFTRGMREALVALDMTDALESGLPGVC